MKALKLCGDCACFYMGGRDVAEGERRVGECRRYPPSEKRFAVGVSEAWPHVDGGEVGCMEFIDVVPVALPMPPPVRKVVDIGCAEIETILDRRTDENVVVMKQLRGEASMPEVTHRGPGRPRGTGKRKET